MASLVDVLLHPERRRPEPEPLQADLPRVVGLGSVAWAVALVVAGVLLIAGVVDWRVPTTCAVGTALGGVWWLHERRRSRRRGQDAPAERS